MLFRKIQVPTGDTKEMTTIRSWTLSWDAISPRFTGMEYVDRDKKHIVFTSENDANSFKKKLIDASELCGNSFDLKIKIKEN